MAWRFRPWAWGLVALLLLGCPLTVPSTGPYVLPAPPSIAPTPTPQPSFEFGSSVAFDEPFDGTALAGDRWRTSNQNGLIRVAGGHLETLNTPEQPSYPYVVTRETMIPQAGGFAFELVYSYLADGRNVSFSLDYLPPDAPGEAVLTEPFMSTLPAGNDLAVTFATETGKVRLLGRGGHLPNVFHRLRLACDGANHYHLSLDGLASGGFTSQRRPRKFWIGAYPADASLAGWPHLLFDRVTADVLPDGAS